LPREGKAEKAKGKAAHTVIHKHGAAAPCCSCWPASIPSFVFWEVKEDGFRAPGFGSLVEGLFTNFYAAVMPKCIVNGRSSI